MDIFFEYEETIEDNIVRGLEIQSNYGNLCDKIRITYSVFKKLLFNSNYDFSVLNQSNLNDSSRLYKHDGLIIGILNFFFEIVFSSYPGGK